MTKGQAITKMYQGQVITHPKLAEILGAKWIYINAGIRDHRGGFRHDIWDHEEFNDGFELYHDQAVERKHQFIKLPV